MSVDLRITNVETNKSQYSVGEDINVDWEVRNSGTSDAVTTYSGVFLFPSDFSDTFFLGSQSAGTSVANTFDPETETFTIPSNLDPGTYVLSVWADYDSKVSESNETNNISQTTITILAALPNLTIADVDVGSQDVSDGELVNTPYSAADNFCVTVDVENHGAWGCQF